MHIQQDSDEKINNIHKHANKNEQQILCSQYHQILNKHTKTLQWSEKFNRAKKNSGLWRDLLQEQYNQDEDELRIEYIRNLKRVRELKR